MNFEHVCYKHQNSSKLNNNTKCAMTCLILFVPFCSKWSTVAGLHDLFRIANFLVSYFYVTKSKHTYILSWKIYIFFLTGISPAKWDRWTNSIFLINLGATHFSSQLILLSRTSKKNLWTKILLPDILFLTNYFSLILLSTNHKERPRMIEKTSKSLPKLNQIVSLYL